MYQVTTIGAGARVEFYDPGDFFRLMEDGGGALNVEFYTQGKEIAEALNVRSGYAEKFRGVAFDRIAIVNTGAAALSVQFVIRLGNEVSYDSPPTGKVSIANGVFTHTPRTVTTTAGALLPANAGRGYLLIQNKDVSGNIWVHTNNGTPNASNGVLIEPGGAWELSGKCPSGAITAVGDIASNANVLVVEG